MTLQEIFDKAAKHLLTQNIKAIVPSEKPNMTGSCKYLDPKQDIHVLLVVSLIKEHILLNLKESQ